MGELFLTVFEMSLKAGYIILILLLIRPLLKKAPKVISYALWAVVAFRLAVPFSVESLFSIMPQEIRLVSVTHRPSYQQGFQANGPDPANFPAAFTGVGEVPLTILQVLAYVWLTGVIALLLYGVISVFILQGKLKNARQIGENVYEDPNLRTPFVLGLAKPRIYLPAGLDTTQRSYIMLHEKAHIRRKDHIVKAAAYILVSVHWFNPLVWLAFWLMCNDMELSCDEKVLKTHEDIKKPYAELLLSFAAGEHVLGGGAIAFGEVNVKERIKNVLNYKKPAFWVIIAAIIAAVVLAAGLFTDPVNVRTDGDRLASRLLEYKTPYVGDNAKVGNIIYLLPLPENAVYDSFELFTDNEPYGITVNVRTDSKTRNYYIHGADQQPFSDNAVIMFALIGNVENIIFRLDDGKGPYAMQFTREWANTRYGKDVRDFAESREVFAGWLKSLLADDSQ